MFQDTKQLKASFLSTHQQCQCCSYYKKSPSAYHSNTHSLWRRTEHPRKKFKEETNITLCNNQSLNHQLPLLSPSFQSTPVNPSDPGVNVPCSRTLVLDLLLQHLSHLSHGFLFLRLGASSVSEGTIYFVHHDNPRSHLPWLSQDQYLLNGQLAG